MAFDIVDLIIQYENGELETDEVVGLFQRLISTGAIEHLQGHYQRMAQRLIEKGYIHYEN